mmetsp:Transcript_40/g.72  ORF Transcript_40/g.72 Transcript_40/m.72 type:complete len:509 (+) Transcript_40:98-1624(+)|eukprot:CAMPEP_0172425682 /NCGR_PEP_ID=MMETSP1064-20121228/33468_1 /TAXON_ID=202472 /ORGANISM="Aulacoseira subarctica , Strain CCAP 1002/5" /LENGTH=508 /DNA_ID=CAMNT_0013168771 /DNA_START=74 /DNA_END=1600 /DNA_ORIENTATION=-
MGGGSTDPAPHKCGLVELLIFVSAILAGTACSICSKLLMEQHSAGLDGNENENFAKPLFQTFGMFLGMLFAFPIHWMVVAFRIPFPGYTFSAEEATTPAHPPPKQQTSTNSKNSGYSYSNETDALLPSGGKKLSVIKETSFASSVGSSVAINISDHHHQQQQQVTEDTSAMSKTWMFFFLAIPSIFDLVATGLCMLGLQYLNVSTYQMLRGSGIVFVAIMKQNVLGHRLQRFQWIGVFWNVVSVFLVGGTAMLASHDVTIVTSTDASTAVLGVMFVLSGAFVQALQFVFEEKVMSMEDSVPPLFLIGMEGFWGTFLCVAVLYPLAYLTPGSDHGSYENPYNTLLMIQNSSTIQVIFVFYFLTIFAYNVLACLVTFMLNSVWHAILDNFRPITVWGVDLFIFYVVTHGALGEAWNKWSMMQLVGMFVLLYGTAIYNAPNSGSLRLEGQWWAFGMNYSDEYRELDRQREEEEMDAKWEELRRKAKTRTLSSPKMSVHTLMLRGTLGSPKI